MLKGPREAFGTRPWKELERKGIQYSPKLFSPWGMNVGCVFGKMCGARRRFDASPFGLL